MGVHGLWKLLEPTGKTINHEALENKVLAIDISIWLHQMVKGFQDTRGALVPNAHLLGLFHRVCKLLFFKIKPVFVFDGGVPHLKLHTLNSRKLKKSQAQQASDQIREKLLKNLVKHKALKNALGSSRSDLSLPSSSGKEEDDMFILPPIQETIEKHEYDDVSSSEDESLKRKRGFDSLDVHSIDVKSEAFLTLPPTIRHEILTELKETRKRNSWAAIGQMPERGEDFSSYQMKRLLKRRAVQASLEEAEKEMKGRNLSLQELDNLLNNRDISSCSDIEQRICYDNITRFLYFKDSPKEENPPKRLKLEENNLSQNEIKKEKSEKYVDKIFQIWEQNDLFEYESEEDSSNENIESPVKEKLENDSLQLAFAYMVENSGLTQSEIYNILNKKYLQEQNQINIDKSNSEKELETEIMHVESINQKLDSDEHIQILSENDELNQEELLSIIKNENLNEKDKENFESSKIKINLKNYENKLEEKELKSVIKKVIEIDDDSNDFIEVSKEVNNRKPSNQKIDSDENIQILNENDELNQEELLSIIKSEHEQNLDVKDKRNLDSSKIQINLNNQENKFEKNIKPTITKEFGYEETENKSVVKMVIESDDENDDFVEVSEEVDNRKSSNQSIVNEKENLMKSNQVKLESFTKIKDSDKIFENKEQRNIEEIESGDDSDDFVEVADEEKNRNSIQIIIDTNIPIEDDIFKDIFETEENKLKKESEKIVIKENKENITHLNWEVKEKSANKLNESTEENPPKSIMKEKSPPTPKPPPEPIIPLSMKELETAEKEHSSLIRERNRQERLAANISHQLSLDAQELLQLFGIPYIIAPMEAEAQCAFLDAAHLTDGTITEDSDIWLFGGRSVYKHFFNPNKTCVEYQLNDIGNSFNLTRERMILLALLVGSDYTVGLSGIGPVTALEVLAAFPPKGNDISGLVEGLRDFREWNFQGQPPGPKRTSLKSKLKNLEIKQGFPSTHVVEAYLEPKVDDSKEKFSWSKPNLDGLREFSREKFGWPSSRADSILIPVMQRLELKTIQTRIDSFFEKMSKSLPSSLQLSKRVQKAVKNLNSEQETEPEPSSSRNVNNKIAKTQRKPRFKKPKKTSDPPKDNININQASTSKDEYIHQRETDRRQLMHNKMKAIETFRKSKKGLDKTKPDKKSKLIIKQTLDLSDSDSN